MIPLILLIPRKYIPKKFTLKRNIPKRNTTPLKLTRIPLRLKTPLRLLPLTLAKLLTLLTTRATLTLALLA